MNPRPRFFHDLIAALALAVAAGVMTTLLAPLFGLATVVRIMAPVLSLVYILYLFRTTRARTGRIVTISAWTVFAALAWWFIPSTPFYLLLHVAGIWLIRCLYAYSALIPAVLDLGIAVLGALTFVCAFTRTGSMLLATWCFFLVQALWSRIPANPATLPDARRQAPDTETFERARRRADSALRELLGRSG